jgi:predicted nuclease of predicted toxin-antitoxin system
MKLLFDENLSFRLTAALCDIYPDSTHVRELGLLGADDSRIWNHAAKHGFLLVSKDTDFYERSLIFGAPPKVIWLRIGNSTVDETIGLLRDRYKSHSSFLRRHDSHILAADPVLASRIRMK